MDRGAKSGVDAAGAAAGAWGPLRHPVFRSIWIASVVSYVGTWMHDVSAAWLMTTLAPEPFQVALVQAATTAPMFLLALPAGALADIVDRRRILIASQTWMLAAASLLGAMALAGAVTPWVLLAATFALGTGAALNAPAWQAIAAELVPRSELAAAITLNGVGMNLARAVGPAIGGAIVAAAGPSTAFLLNAVSFLGVIVALLRWQRPARESALPPERFLGAIRAGVRYVRRAPPLRAVLIRAGAFMFGGSAVWALLPIYTHVILERGPAVYGALLGCFGTGAVLGAVLLPRLRRALSMEGVVTAAIPAFALAALILAWRREMGLLVPALLVGGAAWLTLLSSFNVAAQTSLPGWVRARALATYLVVIFGALAIGSTFWGWMASHAGVPAALAASSLVALGGLTLRWRFPLRSSEGVDLAPSLHWPAAPVLEETEHDRGPVLVTVEYRIDPARARDFADSMSELRRIRERDGAIFWELFEDAADPRRHVECFLVDSWIEHLRQHERVTAEDRMLENRARAFHTGDAPPVVSHLIATE